MSKLVTFGELMMAGLLPHVDVLIANEADAEDVRGIRAGDSRVDAGELDLTGYPAVVRSIVERFPNITQVAITLRESISASHNNWGGMLYEAGCSCFLPRPQHPG